MVNQNGDSVTAKVEAISKAQVCFATHLGNPGGVGTDDETINMRLKDGLEGVAVDSKSAASFAASVINDAIADLSTERGKLGAQINRLDSKLGNLDIQKQSLEAANSRIRDVDVASEMADLTKNQILTQAGTTMLSQANSMPQTALSLLGS